MASPGTDIAFNIARTEGYRAFANKIWNAARFIFMNVDRAAELGIKVDPAALGSMPLPAADAPLEARWIIAELNDTAAKMNTSLAEYRFDEAANTIYQFFWGSFCDWYLEIVKLRLDFSETADKAQDRRRAHHPRQRLRSFSAPPVAHHAIYHRRDLACNLRRQPTGQVDRDDAVSRGDSI